MGGTTGLGFAICLGSVAGLAIILSGESGLSTCLAGAATAAVFLAVFSLRVAFRAGRTLAGFEPLADFVLADLVAGLVFSAVTFAETLAATFVEPPLPKLALEATAFPVFTLATGLATGFALDLTTFPFNGFEAEPFVNGFPLAPAFVFLTTGFDEDPLAFAAFFAITELPIADLFFEPCLLAALAIVFFFDALATAFTNRC